MRFFIILPFLILLASCGNPPAGNDSELHELYALLDSEIANSKEYETQKDRRIADLKRRYDLTADQHLRTQLIDELISEFSAYNADSALYYINYNLQRPAVRDVAGEYTRLLIRRADVYAHAGLFADAAATLRAIPRDSLRTELLEDFYSTYCALYQYLCEYAGEHETARAYEQLRTTYTDSLGQVIQPGTFNYLTFIMSEKARTGQAPAAIEALENHLDKYPSGSREYSILASTLAYIYKTSGEPERFRYYLVLSAISDARGAVKENVSFREVATEMFEDGDIERANRYLKKSIADANFYSALMRNAQSSKMLPVIDEAFTSMQDQLTHRLRSMVWVTGILSAILLVAIFFILRQFRSVHRSKDKLAAANDELSNLSDQLRLANESLKCKNDELSEFNRTKEQYAGLFMEYCSTAISSLQHYQQSLRNLTAKGANRNYLLKKLESTEIADQLLKNFYVKFDEAILNIFPSFVEKFNALLKPDECITLKSGELLNTELRLFALIRIGIDDNAKIAGFLRCSISTVYTYRSKMKKRAVNPENLENEVRNLG